MINADLVAALERERLTRPSKKPTTPQRVLDLTAEAERFLMLQEMDQAQDRKQARRLRIA